MTDTLDAVPTAEHAAAEPGSAPRAAVDTLVPAAVVVLLVAFSAQTATPFWAPKAAVALTVGLGGLASLTWLAARRDPAALAATALVAVAGVSMALSHRLVMSLVGVYAFGTGFLFVVLSLGWWALGRRLSERGRRRLELTFIWGAVGESVFAVFERLLSFHYAAFQPFEGRYSALFDNPVYFAGFLAAAYALLLRRVSLGGSGRRFNWPELAAIAVIGVGLQYSGERLGLIASGAATLVAAAGWAFRGRRAMGLACGAALGIGVGLGAMIDVTGTAASSSVGAAVGVSGSQSLLYGRVYTWEAAGHAILAKPVLGWGPGRYEAATAHLRNASEARSQGPDEVFADAHNFLVEYATTTGVLGLAAVVAFLVLASRRAVGPLAWFAALVGVHMLAEPQSVGVTPLGLLALGAAVSAGPLPRPAAPRWLVPLTALGVAGGMFAGTCLYYGDVLNHHAQLDVSNQEMATSMAWMPPWPDLAISASQLRLFEGLGTPPDSPAHRAALRLARQAARDDPESYGGWLFLASVENRLGYKQAAFEDFRRALEGNPWSVKAMTGVLVTSPSADRALRDDVCRRMQVLGQAQSQDQCSGGAARR